MNSRISLTRKQPVDGSPDEFTFQLCSNIDSCYNRPDTIEQIPACQLLVRRKEVR